MRRLNCMIFSIIFACVSYICCDKDFDTLTDPITTVVQVKVNGYRNLKNRGTFKGCCGNYIQRICQPCRMMFVIGQKNSQWVDTYAKYTTVAIFSKESNELYETYEKYFLLAATKIKIVKALMFNFNENKTVQEEFPNIRTDRLTTYKYDGAFGLNNILELWAVINLQPTSRENRYYMAMIRIDSLYFKEYRHYDKKCCSGVSDDFCDDECVYFMEWLASDAKLDSSNHLMPVTNNRQQYISTTLVSISKPGAFDKNVNYNVNVYSNLNFMDYIKISNINDLPNVEYKLINQNGIYGNIVFNVSWMHTCQVYGGINCNTDCSADFGTEYCDIFSDKSKCLNGASDENSCINLPTQCRQDTCSKHGVCLLIQGRVNCNCEPGYTGKFCQDVLCDSRCNENGDCIGPNLCSCYFPYTGNNCDEYPCDEDIAKKCGQFGHCKILDGISQCDCLNKFFKGVNCTETICDPDCVFGKCVYNRRLDITNCVCNELYEGVSCNSTIKKVDQTNSGSNLKATVAIIAIALIVLIVMYVLIYLNIIKINFTKFNLLTSGSEQLHSETE